MPFPLPLVPFESYMLADDSERHPRTFVLLVQLAGTLVRSAFQSALDAAVERHPLLAAGLQTQGAKTHWVLMPERRVIVDWGSETNPIMSQGGSSIDLTREAGFRVWVREASGMTTLVLEFHHACCDGIGALQVVGDLLAVYGRRLHAGEPPSEPPPDWPQLCAEQLRQRGTFGLARPTTWESLYHFMVGAKEAVRLGLRKLQPLRAPQIEDGAVRSAFPAVETFTMPATAFSQLRKAARAAGATVNDLLLRDLFLAMDEWNSTAGAESGGWLRINMPTNLRRREDALMPAANVMSFTFIDRTSGDCRDEAALLRSIQKETEVIRHKRLGLYFVGLLGTLSGLPGGLAKYTRADRCLATAVLTNVGDPSRRFHVRLPREKHHIVIGNVKLINIVGVPPLRPQTRAGFGVTQYAGQMSISVKCDPYCFSPEDTRRLLMTYVRRIYRSAGLPEDCPGDASGPA